jgi:Putative zinc binding domain
VPASRLWLVTNPEREPELVATMTLTSGIQQPAAAAVCRFCGATLRRTFVDLGMSPLCESYPSAADLNRGEVYYPLHVYVCEKCFLVQLEQYESPENIFSDYAYFSSYSDSWLKHAENYCNKMAPRFGLNAKSLVIEVASNDGYLLQYFVRQNVPVLGIEPAANVAKVAMEKGVPTLVKLLETMSWRKSPTLTILWKDSRFC